LFETSARPNNGPAAKTDDLVGNSIGLVAPGDIVHDDRGARFRDRDRLADPGTGAGNEGFLAGKRSASEATPMNDLGSAMSICPSVGLLSER
jgi:hypothetical protein